MISFLTSAKSFNGKNRENQINAINSWLNISSKNEVILFGVTDGAREIENVMGLKYVPDIQANPNGVPFFNAIADYASKYAKYDIQIYLNCDIIMTNSVLKAIESVNIEKYLLVGQRIDLFENEMINTFEPNIINQLLKIYNNNKLKLHPCTAKDYFIFPRGLWKDIPPLIIGRAGYDCGLLAYCLRKGIPIINGTEDIIAIHQYHDYKHLQGQKEEVYNGDDTKYNIRLINTKHSAPLISDAKMNLKNGKIEKAKINRDLLRNIELYIRYELNLTYPSYIIRAVWRLLVKLNIYKVKSLELDELIRGYIEKENYDNIKKGAI